MKRREFIIGAGATGAWPTVAVAQQPAMPVIGFLNGGAPEAFIPHMAAFRMALGDEGYLEGRNVSIEYRWADGNVARIPALAAEFVERRVSVIVAFPNPSARAAKNATSAIPIVFAVGDDPVRNGLAAGLNRPGGNATGIYYFSNTLTAKRLSLLRDLLPHARRIAVLINPVGIAQVLREEAEAAAAAVGLTIEIVYADNNFEIDAMFAAFGKTRPDALLLTANPLYSGRRVQLATLTARHAIPTMYYSREFTDVGGLMSYGTSLIDAYRQMGVYTGLILKGAKPSELPVVQSTKFEFVINLQTAKALGLEIPAGVLSQADEVIE